MYAAIVIYIRRQGAHRERMVYRFRLISTDDVMCVLLLLLKLREWRVRLEIKNKDTVERGGDDREVKKRKEKIQ